MRMYDSTNAVLIGQLIVVSLSEGSAGSHHYVSFAVQLLVACSAGQDGACMNGRTDPPIFDPRTSEGHSS
jgi:hypothetical protein